MKNYGKKLKFIYGLTFLSVGIAISGQLLEIWNINGYWGLFLLVPGLIDVLLNGFLLTNILVTIAGTAWLAIDNSENRLILPAILIILGISFLFSNSFKGNKIKRK